MAGKKGRSGRKPLLDEIKRHALIATSYDITQAYLDHKAEPLKEKAHLAVGIVKTDLTKPINAYMINNIDNSTEVKAAVKIEFKDKSDKDIIDFLTGRNNGRVADQPVASS